MNKVTQALEFVSTIDKMVSITKINVGILKKLLDLFLYKNTIDNGSIAENHAAALFAFAKYLRDPYLPLIHIETKLLILLKN